MAQSTARSAALPVRQPVRRPACEPAPPVFDRDWIMALVSPDARRRLKGKYPNQGPGAHLPAYLDRDRTKDNPKTQIRRRNDLRTAAKLREWGPYSSCLWSYARGEREIQRIIERLEHAGAPTMMGERLDAVGNPAGQMLPLVTTCHQKYSCFGRPILLREHDAWLKRVWRRSHNEAPRQRVYLELEIKAPAIRRHKPDRAGRRRPPRKTGLMVRRQYEAETLQDLLRDFAASQHWGARGVRRAAFIDPASNDKARSRVTMLCWPSDRHRDMSGWGRAMIREMIAWLRERGITPKVRAIYQPGRDTWLREARLLRGMLRTPETLPGMEVVDYALAERGPGVHGQPRWFSPEGVLGPRTWRDRNQKAYVYRVEHAMRDLYDRPRFLGSKVLQLADWMCREARAHSRELVFIRMAGMVGREHARGLEFPPAPPDPETRVRWAMNFFRAWKESGDFPECHPLRGRFATFAGAPGGYYDWTPSRKFRGWGRAQALGLTDTDYEREQGNDDPAASPLVVPAHLAPVIRTGVSDEWRIRSWVLR